MTHRPDSPLLQGITVLQRGWLSSNDVLLHPQPGDAGAVLVDSSHTLHAPQTLALLRRALDGAALARLVNTHLHSDHCGGNAAVQRELGCRVTTPPGSFAAARDWDESALSYRATGQVCERFVPDDCIVPGATFAVGGRSWHALAAPGHDPHSLLFFDAAHGVLVSADALWENGFGVVFPELDGDNAFDDVAATLDLIDELAPRVVIPGHGAVFTDVADALQRARQRLAAFRADPTRHARHGLKVLVKYHLMEVRAESRADFDAWCARTPLCTRVWDRLGRPGDTLEAGMQALLGELAAAGAVRVEAGSVADA